MASMTDLQTLLLLSSTGHLCVHPSELEEKEEAREKKMRIRVKVVEVEEIGYKKENDNRWCW